MVFVIDNLKYDTDKMELISEKCRYSDKRVFQPKIWRSKKGNWLVTYTKQLYSTHFAESLTESEVKCLLSKYDLSKYEELFGELEEA